MKPQSFASLFVVVVMFSTIVAGVLQGQEAKEVQAGSEKPELATVLIAKDVIERFSPFSEDNIESKEWPAELVPVDAVSSMDQLKGKFSRSRIPKYSPILTGYLVDEGVQKKLEIPKGRVIMSISVQTEDLVSGLLQPGYFVNVLSISKTNDRIVAKTVLENIMVYAIEIQNNESNSKPIVSLALTHEESESLVLASHNADTIRLTLANTGSLKAQQSKPIVVSNRQSTHFQKALRDAARALDENAELMEAEMKYEEADELRKHSQYLRVAARKKKKVPQIADPKTQTEIR